MQERDLLAQLPVCVLTLTDAGECSAVNSRFLQRVDTTEDTVLGTGWQTFFRKEDAIAIQTFLQSARSAAEVELPIELLQKDTHCPAKIRLRKASITGADSMAVVLDTAVQQQQAAESYENAEKFRGAFEHVSAGMAIVSVDGVLLRANDALCKMLGYQREQIEGKTFQSLTHPDDLTADEENVADIISGKITHYQMEKRYVHKDGSIVWALLSVDAVTDEQGTPLYFISHVQDVTNLKKTTLALSQKNQELSTQVQETEKFKMAVEYASDHIIITDAQGTVLYANKAVEQVTGYTPEEATGKKAGVLWRKPMPDEFYAEMWHTIKEEKKTFQGEITNRRKNGEEYIAHLTISPILDDNGAVLFFLGIERDISREKSIDQAKSEFVSFASHQLRTPLTSVKWYTEMLLGGDAGSVTPEQQKYLREIYLGSKRMVSLVTALLNVSRIEMGTFSVEPEVVNVPETIASVLDELKLLIAEKELEVTQDTEQVQEVTADKKLIRIVFQNLLTNAMKYTPQGGSVRIKLEQCEEGAELGGRQLPEAAWCCSVSDTGYGIPVNQADKIFTKLFRADNVREKDTTGTGLGLYITKSIITKSGGDIWFESQENEGSTFYFWLPVAGMSKREGSRSLEEDHEV